MKTQEELNDLKKEYEALNNKLQELSEEELISITGGHSVVPNIIDFNGLFPPSTSDDLGLININKLINTSDTQKQGNE